LDFCDEFLIKIFNRWGELMFESSNILDSWDGTHKGSDVPDGVYFYIIKGSRVNRAGTVTVKRK
jgi:gliding motility-associated-like protein